MEDTEVNLVRIHVEELLIATKAIEGWLDTNEPVRAYKMLMRLNEKINAIVKVLEIEDIK
jgi:hypothetical protein